MARNIKLLLAYDGTSYFGWERQTQFRSLQQTLEEAIHSLTGEKVSVIASGRTDAGVHALGQVANFRTNSQHECATIRRALNALLPREYRVLDAQDAPENFHATYDARLKLYRYVMEDAPVADPFLARYVLHCNWPLDERAMHEAGQCLLGTHDFSAFESAGSPRQSSVRTISHLAVFRGGPEHVWSREFTCVDVRAVRESNAQAGLVFLEVAADGFLYNMVRAIAGTLLSIGRGFWPVEQMRVILASQDRTRAGPTAPAHGLFLARVEY